MSDYADKHSKKGRKERVDHILAVDPKARIDASGYTPPDALNTEKKTGAQPKPRAFKRGGKVEGETSHKHAGRKSRDSGGEAVQQARANRNYQNANTKASNANFLTAPFYEQDADAAKDAMKTSASQTGYDASPTKYNSEYKRGGRMKRVSGGETEVQALRPNVPSGGLYGAGFSPTHAGLMSTAGGLKNGGGAKKRAKGGVVGNSEVTGVRPTGGRLARAEGGRAEPDGGELSMSMFARKEDREAHRKARAEGGRAKGKTNINIIIGSPKGPDAGAVPPPPSAMPPRPPMPPQGLPPAAMGAMAGPMGGMPPAMPAQMPAGPAPRARGGRA